MNISTEQNTVTELSKSREAIRAKNKATRIRNRKVSMRNFVRKH